MSAGHQRSVDEGAGRIREDVVYEIPHEPGAPCAVVDLLCESFGADAGYQLLRQMSEFPADDQAAWERAKALVRENCIP